MGGGGVGCLGEDKPTKRERGQGRSEADLILEVFVEEIEDVRRRLCKGAAKPLKDLHVEGVRR